MKSYYFTIACYYRKKLIWIVEMEKLSRIARFLTDSEKSHRKHGSHVIKINKSFVSIGMDSDVLLDEFKTDSMEDLRTLALKT